LKAVREPQLERELELALRAEFGARTLYARLARDPRDRELCAVLAAFAAEQHEQIAAVQRVLELSGATPARDSRRRRWLAAALAAARVVIGRRVILRICVDAERTRAVWYARFAEHYALTARLELAKLCQGCATRAARHADALGAWVTNSGFR
jgi:hypothetical protein